MRKRSSTGTEARSVSNPNPEKERYSRSHCIKQMPKRVLIADDEEGIVDALTMRLEDEGFECLVATDGAEAWRKICAATPDVVLLDIIMPGFSGWDVAEKMLGHSTTAKIPFIFLSAVDQVADEVRGLEMGAFEFMVKPFDWILVMQTIRAAIAGQAAMSVDDRTRRIDALKGSIRSAVTER